MSAKPWYRWVLLGVLAAALVPACDFSPTAPFAGFDGKGSRLSGTFSDGGSGTAQTEFAQREYEGMTVFVRQNPEVRDTVKSNGRFVLGGIPHGTVTIVFEQEGANRGALTFRDVLPNQEIRIVVMLDGAGTVTLLEQDRDDVQEECARGPGFWCQNQDGKNPNLTAEDFQDFAADAAAMFAGKVAALETPEKIAQAVCNTGDQLLRQLATLALNLASGRLEEGTPLVDEPFATVGEAFEAGIEAANGETPNGLSRNQVKDVLDRINNNENTELEECLVDDDDDDGDGDGLPAECQQFVHNGKITICHIPPGNPGARHTITIGISAWPAHQAHGDYCGPCR